MNLNWRWLARHATKHREHELAMVVDELVERLTAGEAIDVREFVAQHRDYEEELWPLMTVMRSILAFGCSDGGPRGRLK